MIYELYSVNFSWVTKKSNYFQNIVIKHIYMKKLRSRYMFSLEIFNHGNPNQGILRSILIKDQTILLIQNFLLNKRTFCFLWEPKLLLQRKISVTFTRIMTFSVTFAISFLVFMSTYSPVRSLQHIWRKTA